MGNLGFKIKRFLQKNKEFKLEKIENIEEEFFIKYLKNDQFLQVYQNKMTDGFFICKLTKK